MTQTSGTRRLGATDRTVVHLRIDGQNVVALDGDTLLTALLLDGRKAGQDSFTGADLAGFCLMGACQSCWVWVDGKHRVRACEVEVQEGMTITTRSEDMGW